MADGISTGLIYQHAYGILKIIELPTNKIDAKRKISRLILIRNPYGNC